MNAEGFILLQEVGGVLLGSSLFLSPHFAHNARSEYILQYRFPSRNMLGCFGKQEEKYWFVFFVMLVLDKTTLFICCVLAYI